MGRTVSVTTTPSCSRLGHRRNVHEWALLTKTDGGWGWPGDSLTPGVESLGWVQDKGQLALSSYLRMTV